MKEWVDEMRKCGIPGVEDSSLGPIFEALDVNGDGEISLNEMSLFIQGLELTKE